MINPFPDLLTYGIYAPTLLRVAAALILLYVAYMQYQRREEIKQLDLPVFGKNSWWFAASVAFNAAVGLMLLVGYYTQIAALLAIVGHLKGLWLNHRHPSVKILSNVAVLLLLVICLSLLLSGAGKLAFDVAL